MEKGKTNIRGAYSDSNKVGDNRTNASSSIKVRPLAKKDRKTGKVVGIRWRFEKYNPVKRRYEPIHVAQIPEHIRISQDPKVVQEYVNSENARNDALVYRLAEAQKWREQYHDFQKYLEVFETFQKEKAPNSWETSVFYLEKYAFNFFLRVSSLNNINTWHLMFDEFRSWLREVKPFGNQKSNLSRNTQLKVITALNRFLYLAFTRKWGGIDRIYKCEGYDRDSTLVVSAEDLFREDEIELICRKLKSVRPVSEEFFRVLLGTGLRENEAFGLCPNFLTKGVIAGSNSKKLHRKLEVYGMDKYYGYICLESQPAVGAITLNKGWTDRFGKHWSIGSVPRKPLKRRKAISPAWYRYIPIYDRTVWNILARRANEALDQYESRAKGSSDKRDYLFFEGLSKSIFYSDLSKALKMLGLRHRSPHKARHTFLTWFYDKIDEDAFLAEKVGGHRDKRDIERYNHIRELIGRERALQENQSSRFGLVD